MQNDILKVLLKFEINPIYAGLSLNIALGISIVFLIYYVINVLLHNTFIALLSSLIFSIHPTLVFLSADILRENTFLFFVLLSIYFIVSNNKSFHWYVLRLIFAGIFCACAILSRVEGSLIVLFFLLYIPFTKRISNIIIYFSAFMCATVSSYLLLLLLIAPEHKINFLIRFINYTSSPFL